MESNPTKNDFREIIDLYLSGHATAEQKQLLQAYFDIFAQEDDILDSLSERESAALEKQIFHGVKLSHAAHNSRKALYKLAYTCIIIIILVNCWFLFYPNKKTEIVSPTVKTENLIHPGSNQAVLTLADGSRIMLADEENPGEITRHRMLNVKDGHLSYKIKGVLPQGDAGQHLLQIPRGGQYQLLLSDGTKVWLNSASSLSYPVIFDAPERMVQLTGEAYFEVKTDPDRPFIISTGSQKVEVIGTRFNMNVYPDEPYAATTLIEGSLYVSHAGQQRILRPGFQALSSSGNSKIRIRKADVSAEIAWKDNYFIFEDEPLESILRRMSRWYDFNLQYENADLGKQRFTGSLSRDKNLIQLLRSFEMTRKVRFRTSGKVLIVSDQSD